MAKPFPVHHLSEERRKSGNNFTCTVCSERWLESEMRFQDGVASDRRCPNCYEENGGAIARDEDRAKAGAIAASLSAEHEIPPTYPGWFDGTADVTALLSFSPEPRTLTAGGSSAALTITGSNLATTDTITYEHSGITDASAPSLTVVTYDSDGNAESPYHDVLVLTVRASASVPVGRYALVYNDVTYRNVFDVRA